MKRIAKTIATLVIMIIVLCVSSLALAGCGKEKKVYLEEDTSFTINYFTVGSLLSPELNLAGFFDDTKSYIKLTKDGTCILRITPAKQLFTIADTMLKDVNLSTDAVDTFYDQYLNPLFPGFDLKDIDGSLALVENTLGMKFLGLEAGNPEAEALKQGIESGNMQGISIPKDFALELTTVYCIKKLHSDYTGDYTAVYIGNYDEETAQEPYLIFTLDKDEYGKDCLRYYFELLEVDIVATA